ncbi:sigma-70 family RNA polymerase sigma factor [Crocinitomix algicola]|uniref:sigma-70 family RNA polymerase sigma factor n=1 Tax=Crocinitomix algicola TaxID=1740263 RepID=UPI00082AB7BF|nr:sigma-70 family RNA polymerase sigma factor [Crocinitomix algicola]
MNNATNIDTSEWVDDYADMLCNYAYARVNDMDLSKDLVQDTFVSALKGLDNFQGKSTVKTWLFSILKRKIIDHWRKQESRKTNPMSFFTTDGIIKGEFLNNYRPKGKLAEIEVEIENNELREAIGHCISLLPSKYKGIVVDKLVENKESEEVCNEHEITASNLWVIIHRAKLQLRDCLEKKWFD